MPTISVIVPVYNVEQYLRCCVDSILSQTFTDIEVLLVNDGSTDGSGAICDEYAQLDCRVQVFHKENGGVSSARNLGLDEAKGKWIMFVDSDDKVAPEICEKLLDHASEGCIPICTLYLWELDRIENSPFKIAANMFYPVSSFEVLGKRIYSPYTRLYEKSIIDQERLHFLEDLSFEEDAAFNYEYFRFLKGFYVINEPLYYYRILPYSLSHGRYIDNFQRSTFVVHEKLMALAEKCHVNDRPFCDRFNAHFFYSLCLVMSNNMRNDAPGNWYEKIKRNSNILRSEEFKKVYPYRYQRPKDFTKRYIHMLELSYHTGNYFWLWLLDIPGKIKETVKRKR